MRIEFVHDLDAAQTMQFDALYEKELQFEPSYKQDLLDISGNQVWMLIDGRVPDYRWPRRGDDGVWYPRLRLFRRGRGDRWSHVIERLRRELVARLKARA